MPDVGKITVTITTPTDKLAEVEGLIKTSLTQLKSAGKILYAEGSAETKFEPSSWTV